MEKKKIKYEDIFHIETFMFGGGVLVILIIILGLIFFTKEILTVFGTVLGIIFIYHIICFIGWLIGKILIKEGMN